MLSGSLFWCDNKQPEVLLGILFPSRLKEGRKTKQKQKSPPLCLETSLTIATTKAGFSVVILLTNGIRKAFKCLQPPTPFVNPREET